MLDEFMQQNEKLIVAQNYGKFRSNILLGHFIKHEPLIFEEYIPKYTIIDLNFI